MKQTVAIVGVGLIGGSLGQALKRSKRYRVLGIARRPATLLEARRRKAIDVGSTHLADVYQADIVVLATPIDSIVATIHKLKPYLKPRAIITDVGSVKGVVDRHVRGVRFVGAHPLAGSHRTGVGSARPDLFKNATCVLTPQDSSAVGAVQAMWKTAGARVLLMTPEAHDAAVALTSHLPHVVAHALVRLAAGQSHQKTLQALMAGSFRDATRVASSDPAQWAQIFRANVKNVRRGVSLLQKELRRLSAELSRPTLVRALQKSHVYRLPLFHDR